MMRRLPSGRSSAIALPTSLLLLLLALLAAGLRLLGLARDQRLHPDEALYADLSRRVGLWGDWPLTDFPVDKPPLFFFTGGLFQALLGDSEFTVRLPNAFASLIGLALLYALVYRLSASRSAAALSVLLVALSPLEIAFAISGFTDTQMLVWSLAACLALLYQRWGYSGLLFGLGVAVKPAALWLLPPLVLIGLSADYINLSKLMRWLAGFLLIISLISLWDRMGSLGSFWTLGGQNYAGGRLIRSDELLPRAEAWLDWLAYVLPHPALLIIGLGLIGWMLRESFKKPSRTTLIYWGLAGYCLAYLAIHWLTAFNVFDRYLLPILPFIALLIGIGAANLLKAAPAWGVYGLAGLILLLGFMPAWEAAQGHSPVASDAGQHQGIDELATVMNSQFGGEIFYEHWLGWELNYYLGARPQVIHLYFETPADLIVYAQAELSQIQGVRYFVAPRAEVDFWLHLIESSGIEAETRYEDQTYSIYALSLP